MKLKISYRIYALVALAMLALGASTLLSIVSMTTTRSELRAMELKSITDSAISLMAAAAARVDAGVVSEADAKAGVLKTISEIRYRGSEYLFVLDQSATMLMHPIKPELDNTDQSGMKDANGTPIFMEMLAISKSQGSGELGYL